MHYFLFLSFILGVIGSCIALKFSDRIGISDIPNSRSSHETIVPKGAGIGILLAFVSTSLILSIPMGIWLPSLVISLISFWGGDMHRMQVKERLLIQLGCSMFFLVFLLFSRQVDFIFYLLCIPISIFIVGTSNFYNFMDGIDGIAGITGVIGFSLLSFYIRISGYEEVYALLSLTIAFSCLGFLCFNLSKAKAFLGDIGSVLLGFVFSILVISISRDLVDFVVMIGFLAPFYFDELFTMVIRIKNGDSLIIAHRKHIYQFLANEHGISHLKVSFVYGLVQLIIGLTAIVLKPMGIYYLLMTYFAYYTIFIVISIKIRKGI